MNIFSKIQPKMDFFRYPIDLFHYSRMVKLPL